MCREPACDLCATSMGSRRHLAAAQDEEATLILSCFSHPPRTAASSFCAVSQPCHYKLASAAAVCMVQEVTCFLSADISTDKEQALPIRGLAACSALHPPVAPQVSTSRYEHREVITCQWPAFGLQ